MVERNIKLMSKDYDDSFLKFANEQSNVTIDNNLKASETETDVKESDSFFDFSDSEMKCVDEIKRFEEDEEQEVKEKLTKTDLQYTRNINDCRDIYYKKLMIYGASWRVLHTESITDQIYVRINKIINAYDTPDSVIDYNSLNAELRSIVNYSLIYLIQNYLGYSRVKDITNEDAMIYYDRFLQNAYELMKYKNECYYKEAWRLMRLSSYLDFILMKTLRIKELEVSKSKKEITDNYYDIINYALFALIRNNDI